MVSTLYMSSGRPHECTIKCMHVRNIQPGQEAVRRVLYYRPCISDVAAPVACLAELFRKINLLSEPELCS